MLYIHTSKYEKGELTLFGIGFLNQTTFNTKNIHEDDIPYRPFILSVKKWKSTLCVKRQSLFAKTAIVLQAEKDALLRLLEENVFNDNNTTHGKIQHEFTQLTKFFSYEENSETFHKLTFDNYEDNLKSRNYLTNSKTYICSETLKNEEKFFLDYDLSQSQWIVINSDKVTVNDTTDMLVLTVDASNIQRPENFYFNKVQLSLKAPPKALIATIDIETYSSKNIRPDPVFSSDVIYCVSIVFSWSNSNIAFEKYCIVISDIPFEIDGIIVISVKNENELLKKFSNLIKEKNPDCLNGYNILAYDFHYMDARTKIYGMPYYGRFDLKDEKQHYKTLSWEGAGGRFHNYTYPECDGRVVLDTYQTTVHTKTEPGTDGALQSHKLDDVGKYFVNETKHEMPYKEQFKIYKDFKSGNRSIKIIEGMKKIIEYCVQDSVLCMKVFHRLDIWVSVREKASIMKQDMSSVTKTGMQGKYKAQIFRECEKRNYYIIPIKSFHNIKLSGGYVSEPLKGFHKNVSVADFAGMYPSIMIKYNLCPSTFLQCMPKKNLDSFEKLEIPIEIDDNELPAEYTVPHLFYDESSVRIEITIGILSNIDNVENIMYNNGILDDAKKYYNFFNKLSTEDIENMIKDKKHIFGLNDGLSKNNIYTILISAYKESKPTLEEKKDIIEKKINDKKYIISIMKENGYDIDKLETFQNFIRSHYTIPVKKKIENLVVYFHKEKKGIVPTILERLKEQRQFYKKAMKEADDPILKNMYNQRQDGIKILMNSIYGCYGTVEGDYGFMQGSAAITYYGRTLIQSVNKYLADKGCKIIYNDTDSVMFNRQGDEEKEVKDISKEIEDLIEDVNKNILKSPIKIELEKIMDGVFLKKKKYIGVIKYPIKAGSSMAENFFTKGVEAVRGDIIPFTRILYREIAKMILSHKPFEDVYSYCKEKMNELVTGKTDKGLLVVSKTLAQTYASPTAPMNVYAKYLVGIGENAEPGTKLSFLVISSASTKIAERYRPIDTEEKIDYDYYYKMAIGPIRYLLERSYPNHENDIVL